MRNQFYHRFRTLFRIGIIKTIIVNFKLLPFKHAIRLPIVVTKSIVLENLSGKVNILAPVKFGLIKVGTFNTDLFSWNGSKVIFNIKGNIYLKGHTQIGSGCSIVVDEGAELHIGNDVSIGSNCKIICRNLIKIGNNSRIAWETQILDTNFHFIKNIEDGSVARRENKVIIGNNNWFGNRSSIMPGTITNDFFIAASNSLCNKDYTNLPMYSLVGGSPAKLLKTNVVRVLDKEEKELVNIFAQCDDKIIYTNPEPRAR